MKKSFPIILGATCLATIGFLYIEKTSVHAPTTPVQMADESGDASLLCYSLLKDYSEDPDMKDKIRTVLADNNYSEDDCTTLVDYNKVIKEDERKQRKIEYYEEVQKNIKP